MGAVTPGCEQKHLGHMVAQCQALREAVPASQHQTVTYLGEELYMLSLDEHMQLPMSTFVTHQPPPPGRFHLFCGLNIKIMWVL